MSHSVSGDSREMILQAAQRLFVERGYPGISMRKIADAVGVTKAALYYHFRDKEQLFLALLENVLEELSTLIEASRSEGGSCRRQLEMFVYRVMALPAERRASLRLASQELGNLDAAARGRFIETYHTLFIDRITAILAEGVARGEFKPIDPRVATWALLGMMYPYFHVSPVTGVAPTDAVIQQLLTIFFEGLQNPP
uniref:TetR/AcrR family transcriptional regulator n=1 Tax=Caldilinea aerophila TaxID=133453 RepID=A0A7C1FHP3_9CHLR